MTLRDGEPYVIPFDAFSLMDYSVSKESLYVMLKVGAKEKVQHECILKNDDGYYGFETADVNHLNGLPLYSISLPAPMR